MFDIGAGLAALKTAADLTKTLRDAIKSGKVKPAEMDALITQIYDQIIDSRAAAVDAQEEIRKLKEEMRALTDKSQLEKDLTFDGDVYWMKNDDFPYCPLCWGSDSKLVRLQNYSTDLYGGVRKTNYYCKLHDTHFYTPTNAEKHRTTRYQ
jgi:hypothetical protein